MKWLSDEVVVRLASEISLPDLDLDGARYTPVRYLGSGGMGTVWLAQDPLLRRMVALKIVAPENSSPELSARLMREATVLADLEHPGIVPVHDAGTLADGRTFYCMKHVEGETLEKFVRHTELRESLRLLRRIAEPLAFAHSRGIIHRDLKPANIMIGPFGEVLVMDWGLAKLSADSRDADVNGIAGAESRKQAGLSDLPPTAHGAILGTPGYMSPEQQRGETGSLDRRTDVYGLGAVMDFILRSSHSSSDSNGRKAALPKPLAAICDRAMAADIDSRYGSVEEMSEDIGRYLDGLPVCAYRENVMERAARLFSRHQVAIVLLLAYLLMRLLFIAFSR
jgi:serine/threonine-protein kinase